MDAWIDNHHQVHKFTIQVCSYLGAQEPLESWPSINQKSCFKKRVSTKFHACFSFKFPLPLLQSNFALEELVSAIAEAAILGKIPLNKINLSPQAGRFQMAPMRVPVLLLRAEDLFKSSDPSSTSLSGHSSSAATASQTSASMPVGSSYSSSSAGQNGQAGSGSSSSASLSSASSVNKINFKVIRANPIRMPLFGKFSNGGSSR